MILTRQLATRSHVSTNVRLDRSRDAETSLLVATAINHETPRRLCCSHQQFKNHVTPRRPLLLTTAVQNHATAATSPTVQQQFQNESPQRLDRASQPGPVRAITEHSNRLRSATKLDDINQIAPRPPSGLTTEYSPRSQGQSP